MAEITNGLNKIEQITLGEAVFGNGLNERLEQIDDNFQSIITSEYLKGDSGTSFGYATFSFEDGFTNLTDIYVNNTIPYPIGLNDVYGELCSVIGVHNIDDFSFTFIYEIINGKKIAKSSLPFVYYDPSIYGISQDLEQGDRSCVVIYDNGKFKKLNAFPTIYYNKEDDRFYWKINGIETKLTATGPKGERGPAGGFNIVTIGTNYTLTDNIKEYTIEKFLYQNPEDDTYRLIEVSSTNTEDQQIAKEILLPDSPCIVLQNTSSEQFIAIGPVRLYGLDSNGNTIYYVRIWDELAINHSMDAMALMEIFNQMGSGSSPLKGLYVPDIMKRGNFTFYTGPLNDSTLYLRCLDSNGERLYNSTLNTEVLKSSTIESKNIYCSDVEPGDFEWVGNIMLTGSMSVKPQPLQIVFRDDANGNHPNNQIIIDDNNSLTINGAGVNSRLKLNDCAIETNNTTVYIKKGTTLNIAELPSGTGSASLGVNTPTTFDKSTTFNKSITLNDSATFKNTATFNSSATFNNSVTFNNNTATFSKGTLKISDGAKIDITGVEGSSTVNLKLTTGQAKISSSDIILISDNIEVDDVNITGTMDLSNATIAGSKKYQYLPIISNVSYSYAQNHGKFRIAKFTMDPGNHIIYGIKFILKRAGAGTSVKMGESTAYNFKPLNVYNKDAIDGIKTIDFGTAPIEFSIEQYSPGVDTYLYTYVLYDGFISSNIDTNGVVGWHGIEINSTKIVE